MSQAQPDPQTYPATKIFVLSSLALFTAGLSASLRGATASAVETDVLMAIDPANSGNLIGQLLGIAFTGFAITLLLGSIFLDRIGMGRALLLCGVCFAVGTGIVVFGDRFVGAGSGFELIWVGYLLCGLGWGLMEASVNPLTTALYPDEKTHRLNVVHAWWPAGLIVGGLIGVAVAEMGISWKVQLGTVIVPSLIVIAMCIGTPFPRTERASAGLDFAEMWREIPRRPMFLVWMACMFLTAASELAPVQWIDLTLTRTVGMRGIWLIIYVSGMMFVLRHFAGTIAGWLSNVGMLWASAVLATIGLLALSRADSPATGLLAATIWGLGVCFMWPTMLANVSERYPRGGELFIGLMGFSAAIAIQFVLPILGSVYDAEKKRLAGGDAFETLDGERLETVLRGAAEASFQTLAVVPAILIVVFGAIWAWDHRHGRAPESIHDVPTARG